MMILLLTALFKMKGGESVEVVAVKSSQQVQVKGKSKENKKSSDVFGVVMQSMLFQNVKEQGAQSKESNDDSSSSCLSNVKSVCTGSISFDKGNTDEINTKDNNINSDVLKLVQDIEKGIYTKDELNAKITKISEYTGKSKSEIVSILNNLNQNDKLSLKDKVSLKSFGLYLNQLDSEAVSSNDVTSLKKDEGTDLKSRLMSEINKNLNENTSRKSIGNQTELKVPDTSKDSSSVNKISVTGLKDDSKIYSTDINNNLISDVNKSMNENLAKEIDISSTELKSFDVSKNSSNVNDITAKVSKDSSKTLENGIKENIIKTESGSVVEANVKFTKENTYAETKINAMDASKDNINVNKILTASKDGSKALESGIKENTDVETKMNAVDISKDNSNVNKITAASKDGSKVSGNGIKENIIKTELGNVVETNVKSAKENADAETKINAMDVSKDNRNVNNIMSASKYGSKTLGNDIKEDIIKTGLNNVMEENVNAAKEDTNADVLKDSNQVFNTNVNIKDSKTNLNNQGTIVLNSITNEEDAKQQLNSKSNESEKKSDLQMNSKDGLQSKTNGAGSQKIQSSSFSEVLNVQNNEISSRPLSSESNKTVSSYIASPKDLVDVTVTNFKTLRLPGFTELKLKLKPAELGEITIRVVLEKGQIDGVITAERKEVAQMLTSQMDSLKENLKNNNVTFNNINVNIENSDSFNESSRGRHSMYDGKERKHYSSSFESELEKKEEENENGFSILA